MSTNKETQQFTHHELLGARWKAKHLYKKDFPLSPLEGDKYDKYVENKIAELKSPENKKFLEQIAVEYMQAAAFEEGRCKN